jgi:hypothetical protein
MSARLIVCERSNHWAVALHWALQSVSSGQQPDSAIHVRGVREFDQCWQLLEESPASVAVLELSGTIAPPLGTHLLEFGDRFPLARLLVVGDREDAPAFWFARELGAVHTVASIRNLTPTTRIIQRHFRQIPDSSLSIRERIWNRMPWKTDDRNIERQKNFGRG